MTLGLGCMRCTDAATLEAAADAGITLFDTARAYEGNEALVGRALRGRSVRIVTKGGMRRPEGAWLPDGRARAIREDCEASIAALDGLPIDLYLVHAPDPRAPWSITIRALAQLREAGLVGRIGVSNVNRKQLDEALAIAPIEAVEIALGFGNDAALRGGVISRCIEKGIEILAHSPFGGPAKSKKVARDPVLAAIASKHGVSAHDIVLAALRDLHPSIVPIPGATRAETARACALTVALTDADRATLEERFGWRAILEPSRRKRVVEPKGGAEVVMLMGIQGSGKSTHVAAWIERGYERLNRDERGGTLRQLHRAVAERIEENVKRLVLDNTYSTRAMRQDAIAVAHQHGASVSGVWLDTPIEQAQVNIVRRMLAAHGRLLEPAEMQRAKDPSALGPLAHLRTIRDLEVPSEDEGFDSLEIVPFTRKPCGTQPARFVALEAALRDPSLLEGLVCVFAWQPGPSALAKIGVPVSACMHPGGPPRCWCRPPLPGLLLRFAIEHDVEIERSTLHGTKPHHRAMARALGLRFFD